MIAVHRKPRKCPTCGSTRIAAIRYGLMAYSEKLIRDLDSGRVILGGCGMSPDNPNYQCTGCGQTFQIKDTKPAGEYDDIPF